MKQKKFTVFFDLYEFDSIHLFKDVGMVPYYLSRLYGWNSEIVYKGTRRNAAIGEEWNGVKLTRLKCHGDMNRKHPFHKLFDRMASFFYLMKYARKIDVLNIYHYTIPAILNCIVYKFFHPKGFAYIKLDHDANYLEECGGFYIEPKSKLKSWVYRILEDAFFKTGDLFTIETKQGLEWILKNKSRLKGKIAYIPNGVDSDYIHSSVQKIKSFDEKENCIISVGRLGTEQKNNQMLVEALSGLDLKGWKVYLLGPVEDYFKAYMEDMVRKNPLWKDSVFLIGKLEERDDLLNWYNRARIFCLTSRWESFGIVLAEALFFGNYIITTRVGAAEEITDGGRLGKLIGNQNVEDLRAALEELISGEKDISSQYDEAIQFAAHFAWDKIIEDLQLEITKRS